MARQVKVVQNVPPLTPFKAVKSVNLPPTGVVKPMVVLLIAPPLIATVAAVMLVNAPAAGVVNPMVVLFIAPPLMATVAAVMDVNAPAAGTVKPMVELLIVTLLIVPPVMFVFATFSVMMLGFINHCNQGTLGLPVVSSRNAE